MSAEKNRSSALAIVEESVPGTLEAPTLSTQFLALQEGFSVEPNFDQLENAEIKPSIGVSKPIQGLEKPQGSFDHYLRHSGVEGQAPNFLPLLRSVLGASSTNGTERLTAAASTVSVVKLAAGGSDFKLGKAMLVKDGTNGYSIRPVHSRSVNDITLGFDLPAAPAAGLGVGKCVNVEPASSGHPSLSLWMYRGNGGALEAVAGSKVSEMSLKVSAGELINGSFSFQGVKYFFDPIVIAATDTKLDFTDDTGTFVATVTAKTYRTPHELASALKAAMDSANPLIVHTVVYLDASGKFKITAAGTVLSLLWSTGANTANTIGDKIGFLTAADDTGVAAATGYTSDNAQSWATAITPSYDAADPLAAKNHEVLIGDSDDVACFCAESIEIKLSNDIVDEKCVCAESGVQEKVHNKREVEATIIGFLERHDADKFNKFANNSDVRFAYNFGLKSGGNWVPGKCGNVYFPSAVVSAFKLDDSQGLVTMEITVKAYVNASGDGEFFMSFL
jgi:hypothetical protein